jgi:Calcineurin-like phosphoesterase
VLHHRNCLYVSRLSVILSSLASWFLFSVMVNMYQSTYALEDFNFAAVGDWGCTSDTDDTVDNIRDKNPELVLGLGDYSYRDSASCWLEKIQPIDSITKINIGNEDLGPDLLDEYINHFGLTQLYYSYDYQNVHILTMMMESDYFNDSAQYDFVVNDLQTASQNPNIDWIIVNMHEWVYRASNYNPHNDDLAEVYHPLFDQYDVDLVLSGHDHKYHRTYPIKFNPSNPISPMITDDEPRNYIDPQGQIYAVVGTGGVNLGTIVGTSPFIVKHQDDFFGQLDIRFTNNGSKLDGRFYKNDDNEIFDRFSITKNVGGGSGNNTLQASP